MKICPFTIQNETPKECIGETCAAYRDGECVRLEFRIDDYAPPTHHATVEED